MRCVSDVRMVFRLFVMIDFDLVLLYCKVFVDLAMNWIQMIYLKFSMVEKVENFQKRYLIEMKMYIFKYVKKW